MTDAPGLSESALALFRKHVEREGKVAVDDATRGPYRELTRAGLMLAGHTFAGGGESFYVLTEVGPSIRPNSGARRFHHAIAFRTCMKEGVEVGK